MEKLESLNRSLYQEILSRKALDLSCGKEKTDGYELEKKGSLVTLKANNPPSLACALAYYQKAPFKVGKALDPYPLRCLWVKDKIVDLDKAAKRILELGYNHLLLEGLVDPAWIDQLAAWGLKVIVKPVFPFDEQEGCPVDPSFKEKLVSQLHAYQKYPQLYFESMSSKPVFLHHPKARDFLFLDLVMEELKLVEHLTPKLIYATPKLKPSQAKKLELETGKNTLLSSWHDDETDMESILPLVNGGLMKMGGGLWPVLNREALSSALEKMGSKLGMIAVTQQLPGYGGFLDANLWSLGHALIRKEPLNVLVEEWFQATKPLLYHREVFRRLEHLTNDLIWMTRFNSEMSRDKISNEESKALGAKCLSELNLLEEKVSPALYPLFQIFSKDARRILLHFSQCLNITLPNVLREQDEGPAFFTEIFTTPGEGIRSSAKVVLKDKPNADKLEGVMAEVYRENFLF